MHEYRSLTDLQLEKFKGVLLIFGPLPGLILLEKVMQRSGDVSETWNPSAIKFMKLINLCTPQTEVGHSQSRTLAIFLSSISNPSLLTLTLRNSIFF